MVQPKDKVIKKRMDTVFFSFKYPEFPTQCGAQRKHAMCLLLIMENKWKSSSMLTRKGVEKKHTGIKILQYDKILNVFLSCDHSEKI